MSAAAVSSATNERCKTKNCPEDREAKSATRALRRHAPDLFTVQARAPLRPKSAVPALLLATYRRWQGYDPADLRRLHRYMLDIEKVTVISDEMRAVVESEWPELAHKLPPAKPQG